MVLLVILFVLVVSLNAATIDVEAGDLTLKLAIDKNEAGDAGTIKLKSGRYRWHPYGTTTINYE